MGRSVGLPDIHSGYGFAIGNMAAFDMDVSYLLTHLLVVQILTTRIRILKSGSAKKPGSRILSESETLV